MKISIIVPTFCRPVQVRRNTEQLIRTVADLDTEIIVVAEVHADSLSLVQELPVKTMFHPDWRGSMANWNIGASMATGDVLVVGSDDLWWIDGWLHAALEQMEIAQTCYCGFNDLLHSVHYDCDPTHWVITRQGIVDYCGGCIMPPAYVMTFGDNEIAARLRRANQYTWCRQARVDHQHASAGKAKLDRGYLNMQRHLYDDQVTFEQRKAANWPDDFEAVVFPLGVNDAPRG